MTWRWRGFYLQEEQASTVKFRIGLGFDLHRLGPGSHLILGGVEVPAWQELHWAFRRRCALPRRRRCLAGRCGIGQHWRTVSRYRSTVQGDVEPALSVHEVAEPSRSRTDFESKTSIPISLRKDRNCCRTFPQCERRLLRPLGIPVEKISIKAKTMEGLGVIGTEEAIAAEAIALVFRSNDGERDRQMICGVHAVYEVLAAGRQPVERIHILRDAHSAEVETDS